ncbi:MAG TPA: carboxypeptidase-like regulatory domain-containing protein [Chthoniobacterales bacterium]|nr:carboxypeptidase-like regulatory domain-containing protein [Chthoniobacterales bacterium]
MSSFLKKLVAGCILLVLLGSVQAGDPVASGFVEGHLKIVSPGQPPVELTDQNTATAVVETAEYSLYPLVILSRGDKKEITRVTADKDGNYRVALPPGDYILDVPRRKPGFVRAIPQPFTIVSNHSVRVDMRIDTDHSRSNSMQ